MTAAAGPNLEFACLKQSERHCAVSASDQEHYVINIDLWHMRSLLLLDNEKVSILSTPPLLTLLEPVVHGDVPGLDDVGQGARHLHVQRDRDLH